MSTARTVLIEFASENGGIFSRQEAEEALGTGRDGTLKAVSYTHLDVYKRQVSSMAITSP